MSAAMEASRGSARRPSSGGGPRSLVDWIYPSVPARWELPCPVAEAVPRLRAVVKPSVFRTLFREALVGSVTPSRVVLRRHRPWIRNDLTPTFVGGFREGEGGAVLEGTFGIRPLVRTFLVFELSFLALLLAIGLARVVGHPVMGDELLFLGFVLIVTVWTLGLVHLGRWLGRKDAAWVEAAILGAVGGAPARDPAVRPGAAG